MARETVVEQEIVLTCNRCRKRLRLAGHWGAAGWGAEARRFMTPAGEVAVQRDLCPACIVGAIVETPWGQWPESTRPDLTQLLDTLAEIAERRVRPVDPGREPPLTGAALEAAKRIAGVPL
jgi:hypothetical protein